MSQRTLCMEKTTCSLSPGLRHLTTRVVRHCSRISSINKGEAWNGAPLVDAVVERGKRDFESPFHVPGHKRGSRLTDTQRDLLGDVGWRNDATELNGLDNLQSPDGVILEAMEYAARLWNSDHTWFLVNGATVGIHAAVMATCHRGEEDCIIMARNAHQSAHHGVILAGCNVVYAMPECMHGMAHHVTPASLENAFQRAIDSGMKPKAALVVSPTYYGVQSDIRELCHVCVTHGAVLIVDEAHGAHLDFLPDVGGSLRHGAHIVIQSTHKQLGSLTQSSMLHARSITSELEQRITTVLRMLQSSSPSYLLLSSLDASRKQMEDPSAILEPHAAAMHIHEYFASQRMCSEFEMFLLSSKVPSNCDPWRFTVIIQPIDPSMYCTGWSIAYTLEKEQGIVAEMATHNAVVFACGIGTTLAHAKHLTSSLDWLLQQDGVVMRRNAAPDNIGIMPLNESMPSRPRDVYHASHMPVPIQDAEGKIAAQSVTPYPPGIPILLPGDVITRQHIDYMDRLQRHGGSLVGPKHSTILVVAS